MNCTTALHEAMKSDEERWLLPLSSAFCFRTKMVLLRGYPWSWHLRSTKGLNS